jgi:hypothetical protein
MAKVDQSDGVCNRSTSFHFLSDPPLIVQNAFTDTVTHDATGQNDHRLDRLLAIRQRRLVDSNQG